MASYFYATNFTKTKNFVETLDNDENKYIHQLKEVVTNDLLFQQLEFIANTFKRLSTAITELQGRLPLSRSIAFVENVREMLSIDPYAAKLDALLQKNPAYSFLKSVSLFYE